MLRSNIIAIAFSLALALPTHAQSVYSTKSLKLLCGVDEPDRNHMCKLYLHGVVEAWMLGALVHNHKTGSNAYCETIFKVSDDEWLRIVRARLDAMGDGFAAIEVQKALSGKLCR